MMQIQLAHTQDHAYSDFLSLMACPSCGTGGRLYASGGQGLECQQCGGSFPVVDSGAASIPWVFREPDVALLEWKARFKGFLHYNSIEQSRLSRALRGDGLSRLARQRIEKMRAARHAQREQIAGLLGPLALDDFRDQVRADPATLMSNKLPKNQGLSSYYDNIFRDWSWNNGENEAMLKVVERVLKFDTRERLGKVLTLGAGACRLPYDLHRNYYCDLSVVMDINPVLLFLASRVIHGQTVPLWEFPIAPLNNDCYAVLRECGAPQSLQDYGEESFQFLFGDATNPPFEGQSFDTVVTPWLVDIIPQDLAEFVPRINQLLDQDGVWVNSGSLAFFHQDEGWCYGEDEVIELIEDNGFEVLAANRSTVPYMHSPASAHGRIESVFSFTAKKIRDVVAPPRYEYLPEWLRDTSQIVPDSAPLVVASSSYLLQAQVLAAIDGKRSINEIGQAVAEQYGLLSREGINAAKRIVLDAYEATLSQDTQQLNAPSLDI